VVPGRHESDAEVERDKMSRVSDARESFDAALIPGMRDRLAGAYARFRAAEAEEMKALAPPEAGGIAGAYRQRDCPCCGTSSAGITPVLRAHGLDLVDCPSCGLTYSRAVLNEAADAARYARSTLDHEALRLRGSGPYLELEAARDRYYLSRLVEGGSRQGRLLEIGCGTGTLLLEAARLGWQTLGVEPGWAATEIARKRGAEVVHGWFPSDLPDAAGLFDAVAVLDVLEHFADPLRFLTDLRARLAPGGRLLVQVPNWDSLLVRLEGEYSSVVTPGHWSYFTPRTLRALLARSGFRALSVETILSELDRIMTHPRARIAEWLRTLRPAESVDTLQAARLHDLCLGYKLVGIFALD
jgi:SAM-dependent methyltransferase